MPRTVRPPFLEKSRARFHPISLIGGEPIMPLSARQLQLEDSDQVIALCKEMEFALGNLANISTVLSIVVEQDGRIIAAALCRKPAPGISPVMAIVAPRENVELVRLLADNGIAKAQGQGYHHCRLTWPDGSGFHIDAARWPKAA